jgi:UDP:flavonoid glycosyltransferase YjiC (YdhE family)
MYGILAAGRPIVAVAPSETDAASLGARCGFGISADPDKPEQLIAAVRTLLADSARLAAMGRAARAVATDYDRVNEVQKFLHIIEEAARA